MTLEQLEALQRLQKNLQFEETGQSSTRAVPSVSEEQVPFEEAVAAERRRIGEDFEKGDYLSGLGRVMFPPSGSTVSLSETLGPSAVPRLATYLSGKLTGQDTSAGDLVTAEGSGMAGRYAMEKMMDQLGAGAESGLKFAFNPEERAKTMQGIEEVWEGVKAKPWEATKGFGGAIVSELGRMVADPAKYARTEPMAAGGTLLPAGLLGKVVGPVAKATGKKLLELPLDIGGALSRKGSDVYKITTDAWRKPKYDIVPDDTVDPKTMSQQPPRYRTPGKDLPEEPRTKKQLTPEREAFDTPPGQLKGYAQKAISAVKKEVSTKFNEGMRAVIKANPDAPLDYDLTGLQKRISDGLQKAGVDADAIRKGDLEQGFGRFLSWKDGDRDLIKRAIKRLDDDFAAMRAQRHSPETAIETLHEIKVKIRSLIIEGKLKGLTDGEEAIEEMWKVVRNDLSKRPDGKPWAKGAGGETYDTINKAFEEGTNTISDYLQSLSIASNPETVARKMLNAFKDPSPLGARRQFIDELQEASQVPMREMIAGIETLPWKPTGTGAFVAILSGLTGSASMVAGTGMPLALAAIPFTSPRLVRQYAKALGFSKRAIDKTVSYVDGMEKLRKAKNISAKGATVGIMAERLVDAYVEREDENDFLSQLGQIGRDMRLRPAGLGQQAQQATPPMSEEQYQALLRLQAAQRHSR